MKQLTALQQHGRRNSFRGVDSAVDGAVIKSPATIFWSVLHGICCLISLVLGFRFSRLVFFLVVSSPTTTMYSNLRLFTEPDSPKIPPPRESNSSASNSASRVMVGRHGILIRPWPHPDPAEVMKAHRIMEQVQIEQRSQYGIKNPRTLIAVTPTYLRTFQALHLTGAMHSLMNLPYDLVWIVVEAGGVSNETASLIAKSGLKTIHIGFEEKMPVLWEDRHRFESRMRVHALRVVREKRLDGIIVFIDDSNMHSLEFFDEVQSIKWIGAVSLGILAYPAGSDDSTSYAKGSSQVPVQGPACNSSNQFSGWHAFSTDAFANMTATYVGDHGVVLPRKMEWAGFVMNSRLVWEERDEKPNFVKEWDEFIKDGEDVESPLHLLEDTAVVEPLGSCGRRVLVWWLRVEARADSKFPPGWIIDEPLSITVPAKRTPWPEPPPEVEASTENKMAISENSEKHTRKPRRKRSSRSRKKQISSARHGGGN